MSEKDFKTLSRLVDDALAVAEEVGETTTIYLLSMASLELSRKIDNRTGSEDDGE